MRHHNSPDPNKHLFKKYDFSQKFNIWGLPNLCRSPPIASHLSAFSESHLLTRPSIRVSSTPKKRLSFFWGVTLFLESYFLAMKFLELDQLDPYFWVTFFGTKSPTVAFRLLLLLGRRLGHGRRRQRARGHRQTGVLWSGFGVFWMLKSHGQSLGCHENRWKNATNV